MAAALRRAVRLQALLTRSCSAQAWDQSPVSSLPAWLGALDGSNALPGSRRAFQRRPGDYREGKRAVDRQTPPERPWDAGKGALTRPELRRRVAAWTHTHRRRQFLQTPLASARPCVTHSWWWPAVRC